MKKTFFIKVSSLILAFAVILVACVMLVSARGMDEEPVDASELVPESDVTAGDAPESQVSLAEKLDDYNTVTEEDGKSVISIYSESQLAALKEAKDNGTLGNLSTEEILYLIDDTKALFSKYDVIRIAGKNYYGFSLYENGSADNDDASYDPYRDVMNAIYARIELIHASTLNNKYLGHDGTMFVFFGEDIPTGDYHQLAFLTEQVYMHWSNNVSERYEGYIEGHYGVLILNSNVGGLLVPDVGSEDDDSAVTVWSLGMLPAGPGLYKYGGSDEKSVVIEIYRQSDRSLAYRLQLTEADDPDEIAAFEALWAATSLENVTGATGEEYTTLTDYMARVYVNGMGGFGDKSETEIALCSFVYRPDGDIDRFNFSASSDCWFNISGQMHGIGDVTAYLNSILASRTDR